MANITINNLTPISQTELNSYFEDLSSQDLNLFGGASGGVGTSIGGVGIGVGGSVGGGAVGVGVAVSVGGVTISVGIGFDLF